MATEKDLTATRKVMLQNTGRGGRYVHTTSGPVMVAPGTTSEELEMREGELADLPADLAESDGKEAAAGDQDQGGADIPADLADPDSRDGMVTRAKLDEIASAEGVEGINSNESKAEVLAKIVAKRAEAQN